MDLYFIRITLPCCIQGRLEGEKRESETREEVRNSHSRLLLWSENPNFGLGIWPPNTEATFPNLHYNSVLHGLSQQSKQNC